MQTNFHMKSFALCLHNEVQSNSEMAYSVITLAIILNRTFAVAR